MPVGDQGLATGQIRLDLRAVGGVGDRPEPVAVAVLGRRGEQRRPVDGPLDDGGRTRGVPVAAVGQQQRFEMRRGGSHQIGAVLDDMGHHVLVREHDAVGGGREGQCADDAALEDVAVTLLVHVQRGLGVGGQDPFGEPAVQGRGGLFVPGGRGVGLGQDQTHDVVRIRGFQMVQPVGAYDDVVRGRGHRGETADLFGDVAQSTERNQTQSLVRRASCVHFRIVCAGRGCAMIGGYAGDEERGI